MMAWNRYDDEHRARAYGDPDYNRYARTDPRDRGMVERGADEVRSWFGDDEAEQRRRRDVPVREGRGMDRDYGYSGTRPAGSVNRSPEWRDIDSDSERDGAVGRNRSAGRYVPAAWSYTEIWAIPGPHIGHGPRGYQRSDERIKEDVCERLAQHGRIDARNIDVTVENGEVTLRGSVDSRETKRLAEDAVESVSGVRDVRNELRAGMQDSSAADQSNQAQPGRQSRARATT